MTLSELLAYIESPGLDKSIVKYAKMVANKIFTLDGFLRGATSQDQNGKTRGINKKYPVGNLQSMVINIAKVFEYWEFSKDKQYNEEPAKPDNKGFMEDFESFALHTQKAAKRLGRSVKESKISKIRCELSKWVNIINSLNIKSYPPDIVLERHLINEIRKYVPTASNDAIHHRVSELLNLVGITREPGTISKSQERFLKSFQEKS